MKVKQWISYDDIPKDAIDHGQMGGFVDGHNWEKYLNEFEPELHPYLEAIKESVIENNMRLTGDKHQHGVNGVPLFEDDSVACFSYRGWGDLMAAIWNTEEATTKYQYMDFYM